MYIEIEIKENDSNKLENGTKKGGRRTRTSASGPEEMVVWLKRRSKKPSFQTVLSINNLQSIIGKDFMCFSRGGTCLS